MRTSAAVTGLWLLWLTIGCSPDPELMLADAAAQWREARYEDAVRLNWKAYLANPKGRIAARALLSIGNIYYLNLNRREDAIEVYQKLLMEFPGGADGLEARKQLAAIAGQIGDWTQAVYEYDRMLELGTRQDREWARFQKASAYFKMSDFESALQELRRLEETGATNHLSDRASLKIGVICQIQKRSADALVEFRKVSDSACKECRQRALFNLISTHEARFEFDKAREVIGLLDDTPENQALARKEERRLASMRQRAEAVP